MTKLVAVSGYFDPIHTGHIELFKLAKNAGGLNAKLVVIVNNNEQARMKKCNEFMDEMQRLAIVREMKCVDFAILSCDTDRTVCKSLKSLQPNMFANGGDQTNTSIPESDICKTYNIELIDNLGDKIQSSSTLIERAKNIEISKK